ncbi:hypothetical protein AB4Z52_07060 [Rhizobium sp. 2YAF20]|uniref:hypothetical protein n=1 Tax=Rhizobium sp. 2YAF20 TaxID=3233027 RepID=UPI003F95CF47
MKKIAILAAALLAGAGSVCAKDPSVADFLEQLNTDSRIQNYLGGAGTAWFWSNLELKRRGLPPFFCQPKNLAINQQNYIQMLQDFVKHHPNDLAESYVAWPDLLLQSLVEAFPCPGAKP